MNKRGTEAVFFVPREMAEAVVLKISQRLTRAADEMNHARPQVKRRPRTPRARTKPKRTFNKIK